MNPAYCPAVYPPTGHQCELQPGHTGHHDRIIAGEWVRWCDYPLTCDRLDCDLSAARASRDARVASTVDDLRKRGLL